MAASLIVAAAQHSPVFLNRSASVEKACSLIADASQNGAKLVVFPEAFIPGYPDWVWLLKNSARPLLDQYYQELLENAVTIPDHSTELLAKTAASTSTHVAIGINERNAEGQGRTSSTRCSISPIRVAAAKRMFDAAGHYSRPDVCRLTVRTPIEPPSAAVDRQGSGSPHPA